MAESAAGAQASAGENQPDIVVIGTREKAGAEVETTIDETQIEGYGTDSIAQLVLQITPLIGGMDDQPAVIVNGKIISDPKEIGRYSPEALTRVEILTRDAATKYGYPAEKRIVNLVLKSRFKSYTVGLERSTLAELEGNTQSLSLQRAVIRGDDRWSADAKISRGSPLLRSTRHMASPTGDASLAGNLFGIGGQELDPTLSALANTPVSSAALPADAGSRDPTFRDLLPGANQPTAGEDGQFRTISPATSSASINLSFSKPLGETSVTASLHATTQDSVQQVGLATAVLDIPIGSVFLPLANETLLARLLPQAPLVSDQRQDSAGISAGVVGRVLGVSAVLNLTYDRSRASTVTDRGFDLSDVQARILANDPNVDPFGVLPLEPPLRNRTISTLNSLRGDLTFRDSIRLLPAGPISWTLGATFRSAHSNMSTTSGTDGQTVQAISSQTAGLRLDLGIPLTRPGTGPLSAIGRTSLNFSTNVSLASKSASRAGFSAGFSWAPSQALSLTARTSLQRDPPSDEQRYSPELSTPNIEVFDYRTGSLVNVTEITGGNPNLKSGSTETLSVGMTARPLGPKGPHLNLDYQSVASRDSIGALPPFSELVETTFPDRVLRSADGQLSQLDIRPVNYARDSRSVLRTGFNWRATFRVSDRETALARSDPTRWNGSRSIQIAVTHEWVLASSLRIKGGMPDLDRLQGRAGTEGRHKVQTQINLVLRGIGVTMDTVWQSGYRQLQRLVGTDPSDLTFGPIVKTNLQVNLYPFSFDLLGRPTALRGSRLSIGIDNLLDSRRSVHRLDGTVPAGYSRLDLDPFGRTFKLSLRRGF